MAKLASGFHQRGDTCACARGTQGKQQSDSDGCDRFTTGTAIARAGKAVKEEVLCLANGQPGEQQDEHTVIMSGVEQMFHNVGCKTGGTGKISAIGGNKKFRGFTL